MKKIGIIGIFALIVVFLVSCGENEDVSEEKSSSGTVIERYEQSGAECKTVDNVIERGDCFQEVNDKYLRWYMDQSKREFYFPFQIDQEHWKDILYYSLDSQSDETELKETEHFTEYADPYSSNPQRGENELEEYWYVFSNIFPKEYRESLAKFYWTDTGEDFVFGVGRDEENLEDTVLMISHNIGDYYPATKSTLIHEFAHILTVNEEQVQVMEEAYFLTDTKIWEDAEEICDVPYVYGWGCVEESSYIYSYYQEFWEDIDKEFRQINWETEDDYKEFFLKYEDRFFNSYQGTYPEEDLAESFTFFVMMNSSEIHSEENSEMKYDKVDFFYQYDELVELRTMILENIYDLSVKDGKFY
ncbi:hypothetical protein [Ornithinibacillus halophilus]|uniref:Uncharacterized protein n=1 Tax=Ornithinibacillus halophilus TaxID=930117 RepID=A0A1M5L9U0_9BACI|nr:hypothetical protein [Ornithinibacillus halophilus]SHG61730.1 hypothetical protein SAMN05216225_104522 [Ornithinibacillus halophilus]